MHQNMKKYVRYRHKIETKNSTHNPSGTLSHILSPERPFQQVEKDSWAYFHYLRPITGRLVLRSTTRPATPKPRQLLQLKLLLSSIVLCTRFVYDTGSQLSSERSWTISVAKSDRGPPPYKCCTHDYERLPSSDERVYRKVESCVS